jgi:precorrin-2/cobalt-factor-2 C20-methyltransferase
MPNRRQKKPGRLYGVGVGPGDPELLTLKAKRILARVPVIFVPKKTGQSASYAKLIIADLISDDQKVVELILPMLRDKKQLAAYWREAADTIWGYLKNGEDGAFVNLGDPLLYGTFIHIWETVKKNHPQVEVEVVPGISSINAAAARALFPLASDDERIAIISGNREDRVIRETIKSFDTVVFMKMNNVFARLLIILEDLKLTKKCVYVRRGTTREEEIIHDVSRLKGAKVDYFSLLILRK